MSIFDTKDDEAAFDEVVTFVLGKLTATVIPALQEALTNALDGLVITVTVSRKQ